MEISLYLSFCLAAFLMALLPGPDNLFVMTESIAKGKRNGLWIAFGLNSGVLVHTLAAATGLSLILKQSPMAYQLITYLGAAYLLYLAYQAAKEKPQELDFAAVVDKENAFKLYRTGVLMNILNPKVALFFIAFLPQFVRAGESLSVFNQFVLLGFSFLIIGFATFATLAILAAQLRKVLKSKRFWNNVKWLKVSVLILMATLLFWV